MTNKTERCPREKANSQSYHGICVYQKADQDHQRTFSKFVNLFMFETYREGKNPGQLAICPVYFWQKRRVLQIRPKDEHDQA